MFFNKLVVDRPRRELLDHVAKKKNLCLGVGRQGIAVNDSIWSLITVSTIPIDKNVFRRGGVDVSSLYLYPTEKRGLFDEQTSGKQPNFSDEFLADVYHKLKSNFKPEMIEDAPRLSKAHLGSPDSVSFSPEHIFYYA